MIPVENKDTHILSPVAEIKNVLMCSYGISLKLNISIVKV